MMGARHHVDGVPVADETRSQLVEVMEKARSRSRVKAERGSFNFWRAGRVRPFRGAQRSAGGGAARASALPAGGRLGAAAPLALAGRRSQSLTELIRFRFFFEQELIRFQLQLNPPHFPKQGPDGE
jgi:hypothetical protein